MEAFRIARWQATVLVSTVLTASAFASSSVDAPTSAPSPVSRPHVYLFPKAVPMDVKIGEVGRALHYTYWALDVAFKTTLTFLATHSLGPTVGFFMFTSFATAPHILGNTLIHLKILEKIRSSRLIKHLSGLPGIRRAMIVSGGDTRFEGIIARERTSQNYVFVETDEPLPAEGPWVEKFGAPVDVTDSAGTRVKFELRIAGELQAAEWAGPLAEILDGKPIPTEVADRWRDAVREYDGQVSRVKRVFKGHERDQALKVDATLSLPDGRHIAVESMIAAGQVRRLLGMRLVDKAKDFFTVHVLNGDLVERSVALTEKKFRAQKCEEALLLHQPGLATP